MMKRQKSIFQKASLFFGIVSFILAVASGIFLYFRVAEVGGNNPISASLLASVFFFICVGAILLFIGLSNIPSFKLNDSNKK